MDGTERGVRWIDAQTGEDFTDRMNDSAVPPGEGILEIARALARRMAAQQIKAERQLLEIARTGLDCQSDETSLRRAPEPGDEVTLEGVTYRYDGSTDDADHFTRLKGVQQEEALVSLRQGSPEARWVLQQFAHHDARSPGGCMEPRLDPNPSREDRPSGGTAGPASRRP